MAQVNRERSRSHVKQSLNGKPGAGERVFAGFAAGTLVPLQQFGFGMAVAVLVDATLIRTVLVPATMKLLGRGNWYLPGFLNWLPEFRFEAGTAPEQAPAPGGDD